MILSNFSLQIVYTKAFRKELKLCQKQNRNINKLFDIVEKLSNRKPLLPSNKVHRLQGKYKNHWECHIEPDWVLIWKVKGNVLSLERIGSHSKLEL